VHREKDFIFLCNFNEFYFISAVSVSTVVIKLNRLRLCQLYEQIFHGEP
jgi:hypothetical protein